MTPKNHKPKAEKPSEDKWECGKCGKEVAANGEHLCEEKPSETAGKKERGMRISPKEIEIEECRAQVACMLNELWHSRLPKIHWSNVVRNTHYICYVFKYKQAIIGTAIWSSPVAQNRMKDGKRTLELRRLALSDVCPKNTATRVISKMIKLIKIKFPEITKLVSYQDTNFHLGTIYRAANWKIAGQVPLMDWNTETRKRNELQSEASKIRWEYSLG